MQDSLAFDADFLVKLILITLCIIAVIFAISVGIVNPIVTAGRREAQANAEQEKFELRRQIKQSQEEAHTEREMRKTIAATFEEQKKLLLSGIDEMRRQQNISGGDTGTSFASRTSNNLVLESTAEHEELQSTIEEHGTANAGLWQNSNGDSKNDQGEASSSSASTHAPPGPASRPS